ncbi:MAG: DNA gyrase inhibitor YacG [Candidatus Binatia bacterium]
MKRPVKCPMCRRETQWIGNPYRPFCSERCRTLDLGAWASESYRIPGQTTEEASSSESELAETDHPPTRKT